METSVAKASEGETYKSILCKIERLLPDFKSADLSKMEELSEVLLTIAQEDLQVCRRTASKRGLPWEGKLHLFGGSREQDGFWSAWSDRVKIGSEQIALISIGSIENKEIAENWETGIVLSEDERVLFGAFHKIQKKFENPKKTVLICEIIMECAPDGKLSRIISKRNTDQNCDSFNHRPQESYVTHELLL
jgi:hypothetical protein